MLPLPEVGGLVGGVVSEPTTLPVKLPAPLSAGAVTGVAPEVVGLLAVGCSLQAQDRPWSQPQGLLLASYTVACTPELQEGALSQLTTVPVVLPVPSLLPPVTVGCCWCLQAQERP